MSRKERRAWARDNKTWLLAARSGTSTLRLALLDLPDPDYSFRLSAARQARKDFRWARRYVPIHTATCNERGDAT